MNLLFQRVSRASVKVNTETVGKIGLGALIFLGILEGDDETNADFLAHKISELRVFDDKAGKMNKSIQDVGGAFLVVSQFTLCAELKKGNRPSFTAAAAPDEAKRLYQYFIKALRDLSCPVETGEFQADMDVELINQGPVTFWMQHPR